MIKKLTAVTIAAITAGCIGLAGCSAGGESTGASDSGSAAVEQEAPADLTGSWKQTNSASQDAWMDAEITGEAITVNWVSDGGDTKSVYWVGTYEAPNEPGDSWSWESSRDKEQTDGALLASTNDTKVFSWENGELSFEASAMGTTTTVRMEKEQ